MAQRRNSGDSPRTVLEQKIRERKETLTEFVDYGNRFAHDVGESGTLSERNLKRLVSGMKPNGEPIGHPRAATARLLERIFGISIDELLSPVAPTRDDDAEPDLRQMLRTSRRVDASVLGLLSAQLDTMRQLDRRLGAIVAHDEVTVKLRQVRGLLSHSLRPGSRDQLAALLSEIGTLAGWQALDLGKTAQSWQFYEQAKTAAKESNLPAFEAHATAEQAFVLLDFDETGAAVELLTAAYRLGEMSAEPLLRAWLAAALGEAVVAHGERTTGLRWFDRAESLLPAHPSSSPERPYVVLDLVHLARWRGHVLARVGQPDAVDVLASALSDLDPTFTRAETAMRVDLATALVAVGEHGEAQSQVKYAQSLAMSIGSARQQNRIKQLVESMRDRNGHRRARPIPHGVRQISQ